MFACFYTRPTKKQFVLLFLAAFIIRATMFFFFIQHTQRFNRYRQPDSADYHNGAVCLAYGNGMSQPGNNNPIFWRTPGYPLYLSIFYHLYGLKSGAFEANETAQKAALWVQIFVCSFIPIILFYLAYLLTSSYVIAWLTAWISVCHIGFILASTFLLTEGLAVIFFYLFLLFFLRLLINPKKQNYPNILLVMAMLSMYTWIRPMGEFVAILSTAMLIIFGQHSWKKNIRDALLFFGSFFITLLPWYIRNYRLTGTWFFCPLSGVYLNVFCAPKILRRTTEMNLHQAWQYCSQQAALATQQATQALRGTGMLPSPLISKQLAVPILCAYPLYFMFDWVKEVCKTTFDLYAYQLIAIAKGSFHYDPLEEFLTEKLAECLWTQPAPLWIRTICWAECAFSIVVWIGLIAGAWKFFFKTFFVQHITDEQKNIRWIWLLCGIIIGAVISMTGGFGYARLRLPIEPLMLILSVMFWYTLFTKKRTNNL
ncbi:MAG TPA: hypothetical protein PLU71_04480 [Candidatus Dependentiae bacterium]|nr:hypothetical protein [Candidatus Dependentiae bacterium]HRQ63089.1 hypothetical protein [Candidatus Dependentiae bacterium]